jgi:hypothetical protein
MYYFIKLNDMLGYDRIGATHSTACGDDLTGFRQVDELEYTLAGLMTQYNSKRVMKLGLKLAQEINGTDTVKDR